MVDAYTAPDTGDTYHNTGTGSPKHMIITSKGVVWIGRRTTSHNWHLYAINPNEAALVAQPGDASPAVTAGGLISSCDWSWVCDEHDNVHLVYAKYTGSNDGRAYSKQIFYRHGICSGPTTITWGPEIAVGGGSDYWGCPDIVAHYLPETNQTYAHIFFNYNWVGNNRHITTYTRVRTNPNDVNNYAVELATMFPHDGSQTFIGKVSCELRHAGDGKRVYRDATGVAHPDIFYTFTSSGLLHFGNITWNGSTWVVGALWNDGAWGNCTANNNLTYDNGQTEHHRWNKTLYDPRDDRAISIGWLNTGGVAVSRQALVMYEWTPGATSWLVALPFPNCDWGAGAPGLANSAVGCAATLNPLTSNIEIFGCVGPQTSWYVNCGRAQVLRPKGSNTRTYANTEVLHGTGGTDGARADILPYPPNGENHCFTRHTNTWHYYWRNNRGCNTVAYAAGMVGRRPKFRLHSDGVSLTPVDSTPKY